MAASSAGKSRSDSSNSSEKSLFQDLTKVLGRLYASSAKIADEKGFVLDDYLLFPYGFSPLSFIREKGIHNFKDVEEVLSLSTKLSHVKDAAIHLCRAGLSLALAFGVDKSLGECFRDKVIDLITKLYIFLTGDADDIGNLAESLDLSLDASQHKEIFVIMSDESLSATQAIVRVIRKINPVDRMDVIKTLLLCAKYAVAKDSLPAFGGFIPTSKDFNMEELFDMCDEIIHAPSDCEAEQIYLFKSGAALSFCEEITSHENISLFINVLVQKYIKMGNKHFQERLDHMSSVEKTFA